LRKAAGVDEHLDHGERRLHDMAVDELICLGDKILDLGELMGLLTERQRLVQGLAQRVLGTDAHDHHVHAIGERRLIGKLVFGIRSRALHNGSRIDGSSARARGDGGLAIAEGGGLRLANIHQIAAFRILLIARRNLEPRQRLVLDIHDDPLVSERSPPYVFRKTPATSLVNYVVSCIWSLVN